MPLTQINLQEKKRIIFIKNLIAGLGWMIGATLAFTLFITLLSFILKWLGGLPIVGNFFANLIQTTNQALEARKSFPK